MTHPLTDEIIEELAEDILCYEYNVRVFNQDMRAAADWQLEQVIKFILKEDMVYYDDPVLLANHIKEAMRPTTDVDLIQTLAAIIREVDGKHSLGASALAEAILSHHLVINFQTEPYYTIPEKYD